MILERFSSIPESLMQCSTTTHKKGLSFHRCNPAPLYFPKIVSFDYWSSVFDNIRYSSRTKSVESFRFRMHGQIVAGREACALGNVSMPRGSFAWNLLLNDRVRLRSLSKDYTGYTCKWISCTWAMKRHEKTLVGDYVGECTTCYKEYCSWIWNPYQPTSN